MSPIVPRTKEMRILPQLPLAPRRDPGAARPGSLTSPAMGSDPEHRRTFYVETYGCEMNNYDSEYIAGRFLEEGWAPAPDPESADLVLFNTCSVRQAAEEAGCRGTTTAAPPCSPPARI